MDNEIQYEIDRVKERLESKIEGLEDELRRCLDRKADKEHSHSTEGKCN